MVSWNNKYGDIEFFITVNETIYGVIREIIRDYRETKIVNSQFKLHLSDILVPTRSTYNYYVVPTKLINDKILCANNYICIPPNLFERK